MGRPSVPAKPGGKAQADKPERRRPGTVGGAALPAAAASSPYTVGQDVEVDVEDVAADPQSAVATIHYQLVATRVSGDVSVRVALAG